MLYASKVFQIVIGFFSCVIIFSGCQNTGDSLNNLDSGPDTETVTVSITAPANDQTFAQNEVIPFSGSAVLGANTQIEMENLVWSSDKDGIIGFGTGFSRSGLSVGNHFITLTATASTGESGTAQLELNNQSRPNGMVILIDAPAGTRINSSDPINLSGSALATDGSLITNPLAFEWRSSLETNPGPLLGDGMNIEPAGLAPGLHTITMTATATNGTQGSASIDLFVEFENSDIQLDILAPFNGVQIVQGSELTCNGSAGQSGGGEFQDITWTSSMDGWIGASETCIVPYLSLGTHRITMTATATNGQKATVSTIVEVIP